MRPGEFLPLASARIATRSLEQSEFFRARNFSAKSVVRPKCREKFWALCILGYCCGFIDSPRPPRVLLCLGSVGEGTDVHGGVL